MWNVKINEEYMMICKYYPHMLCGVGHSKKKEVQKIKTILTE